MKNLNKEDYKIKSKQMAVKPFVFNRPSVSSVSIRFLVLLLLQVLMLGLTKSYAALCVVGASTLAAILVSTIDYFVNDCPLYKTLNLIIQGIIIGLLLPENYPLVSVFFITFISLFLSKTLIFNKVNTSINVAALAVVFAWFVGKKFFPDFGITTDMITLKNSSMYLIQNGSFPIYKFDSMITSFLNNHILCLFNTTIPEGFVSMLWDTHSVIPAFRFNILTIISSIFLFADKAFSGIIPVLFLFVYSLLVRLFSSFAFGGLINQGDMILALLTSGVLFGTVFLMQLYCSNPVTLTGKIIQGLILGALGFAIIGCGTSPIGMAYTVLIGNITSMIIRVFEEKHNNRVITKNYSNKVVQGEI